MEKELEQFRQDAEVLHPLGDLRSPLPSGSPPLKRPAHGFRQCRHPLPAPQGCYGLGGTRYARTGARPYSQLC
jgi:hypothetical protein